MPAGRPRLVDDVEARRIYNLRHTVHLPVKDIAEMVGVSSTTVYKALREYQETASPEEIDWTLQARLGDSAITPSPFAEANRKFLNPDPEVDAEIDDNEDDVVDMVSHPPHYERGPEIKIGFNAVDEGEGGHLYFEQTRGYFVDDETAEVFINLEHIEVFRYIKDPRLATAFKYLWRVAFGGKTDDPADDIQDIGKIAWYLKDFVDNPVP